MPSETNGLHDSFAASESVSESIIWSIYCFAYLVVSKFLSIHLKIPKCCAWFLVLGGYHKHICSLFISEIVVWFLHVLKGFDKFFILFILCVLLLFTIKIALNLDLDGPTPQTLFHIRPVQNFWFSQSPSCQLSFLPPHKRPTTQPGSNQRHPLIFSTVVNQSMNPYGFRLTPSNSRILTFNLASQRLLLSPCLIRPSRSSSDDERSSLRNGLS